MKKKICFIILVIGAFSCSKDSDPKVIIKPESVGKPAIKVYFSENIVQRIGVLDLNKLDTFSTLLSYEKNGKK